MGTLRLVIPLFLLLSAVTAGYNENDFYLVTNYVGDSCDSAGAYHIYGIGYDDETSCYDGTGDTENCYGFGSWSYYADCVNPSPFQFDFDEYFQQYFPYGYLVMKEFEEPVCEDEHLAHLDVWPTICTKGDEENWYYAEIDEDEDGYYGHVYVCEDAHCTSCTTYTDSLDVHSVFDYEQCDLDIPDCAAYQVWTDYPSKWKYNFRLAYFYDEWDCTGGIGAENYPLFVTGDPVRRCLDLMLPDGCVPGWFGFYEEDCIFLSDEFDPEYNFAQLEEVFTSIYPIGYSIFGEVWDGEIWSLSAYPPSEDISECVDECEYFTHPDGHIDFYCVYLPPEFCVLA